MSENKKTISKSTKVTEVDSIPTSANPRKGRMGRTSVVEAEKKGKGLVRPSGRSICADCASLHTGRCPLTPVLRRYDIVVWVEECGQLTSLKGVKV